MTGREGTSGGTGFLFGNIDRKGRLEEEYLDDDAKDTLDNVGSKVTNNNELRQIEALPLKSAPTEPGQKDDDDDYDDLNSPNDTRVDYYDEQDDPLDDGLDETQRRDMADLALRNAAKPASPDDEDENYDDEDETPAPVAPVAKSPPPAIVEPALAEQRRLMLQARQAAFSIPRAEPQIGIDADLEEVPLAFSRVFHRPSPAMRYVPRRRRYGVVVQDDVTPLDCDDTDRLLRSPSPPDLDPVAVILALDRPNAQLRAPFNAQPERGSVESVFHGKDLEEYIDAAAPLGNVQDKGEEDGDDFGKEMGKTIEEEESVHAPVQQVCWDEDIVWRDEGAGEDDDEPWYTPGLGEEDDEGDVKIGDGGGSDDDDDDDDIEFEDPVITNAGSLPPSMEKEEDSDEDMEWEDGDMEPANEPEPVAKTMPLPVLPPKLLSKPPKPPQSSVQPIISGFRSSPVKATGFRTVAPPVSKPVTPKPVEKDVQPIVTKPKNHPGSEIVRSVIAPNRDLVDGNWVHGVVWDSQSEAESEDSNMTKARASSLALKKKFSRLVLDMNDPNMTFEQLSDSSTDPGVDSQNATMLNSQLSKTKMKELIFSSGTQVHQLLEADQFNISNDLYYASGASNYLKVDRRSILRGLQNAPPAVKCQTTKGCLTVEELLSFRRPKLSLHGVSKNRRLQPFRRKRPKGGNAQIAGQIPKKKTELLCSEKDAYRVSLYEYALERQPSILPIPGMASRIVTYARKKSSTEAAQASKDAAGTAEADTVFLSPDELPPVHAGDIQADGKPLSVIESHVYSAPCVKTTAPTTDFLLVRQGKDMYVREIDSVVSVGITEPKIEVMAPNTERYKKYSKDRVLLWVMREFSRQRKTFSKQQKSGRRNDDSELFMPEPPYIEKEQIFAEFLRRRTYPETTLIKLLRELSRYQNGRYTMIEETSKGLASKETELLRTLTPQETAAFETMESGWEHLLERGVQSFTHPSQQGNILSAADAEKSGIEAGPAVGTYMKCHLLKTPWYQSQNIIAAHRSQRKELTQVISLARIVNDLKEGGAVMESRLMSLSATEMTNVLTNHYRANARKIPAVLEERRTMLRELSQKKSKGNTPDLSDYSKVIGSVLKRHRDAGLAKGAGIAAQGTAMTGGTFLGLPLDVQRKALEEGDISGLPTEVDDYFPEKDGQAVYDAAVKMLDKKRKEPTSSDESSEAPNHAVKKYRPTEPAAKMLDQMPKSMHPHSSGIRSQKPLDPGAKVMQGGKAGDATKKKPDAKITQLKVTRKAIGPDGKPMTVVKYVTDPQEIGRILNNPRTTKTVPKKASTVGDKGPRSSAGGLKISIDLKRLTQGVNKAANKKPTVPPEKKKSQKKAIPKASNNPDSNQTVRKIGGEKGQIGKIKINTKQLNKDKEQAALKRKMAQYGEGIEYRAKKTAKTSRRKRNGGVQLNGILEKIERNVRETEGYIIPGEYPLRIARLRDGESPPPKVLASNLAMPKGTGLDFTAPVDIKKVPKYPEIVKKPMYLNLIRQKCKKMLYKSSNQFVADMKLMAENARLFNSSADVQWVVQHAQLLLEVAQELVHRKTDEISAAEEMVRLEQEEAKAAGVASSGKNKNRSKGKNRDGKKGTSKKKDNSPKDVVEIADESDKEVEIVPVPSTPVVVNLNDDTMEGEDSPWPNASPPTGSSILDAGITANDIYTLDGPVLPSDSMDGGGNTSVDNLVLDLDDVGGTEGL